MGKKLHLRRRCYAFIANLGQLAQQRAAYSFNFEIKQLAKKPIISNMTLLYRFTVVSMMKLRTNKATLKKYSFLVTHIAKK